MKYIQNLGDIMKKSHPEKEVKRLFDASEDISDRVYTLDKLKGLPKPVQRYFKFSLQENQRFLSYARLKHGGEFRPKEKWMQIKGEEYFTIQKPGFIWYAKVPLISAKDMYLNGKGNFKIKLLSLIKIVDATGKEVDQGELLRWLGETPIFPTALLPSENLCWESIDDNSAKVFFTDSNLTVEGVFYFAESGEITQFKAKRYKDKTLEDWTGYYKDYKTVDGMKIPFSLEVVWNLKSGDFSYAKFNIETIEFNVPLKYK